MLAWLALPGVCLLSSAWGVVPYAAAKSSSRLQRAKGAVQPMFATKRQRRPAAPRFGCNGAHRMGHQSDAGCSSHARPPGGELTPAMGHK